MGALTSKPYTFQARIWEISSYELADTSDSLLTSVFANFRGTDFLRILPKIRKSSGALSEWISDRTRFSYYSYKYQRLSRPLYRFTRSVDFIPVSWNFAVSLIAAQLSYKNSFYSFYLSTRTDFQTCFSLSMLLTSLEPYRYACYIPLTFHNFTPNRLCTSDFSIQVQPSDFSSLQSVCFFGYDFNSALPLLDFQFSKNFFSTTSDVFTIGSNFSFINYPVTSLGLSNTSFVVFLRGKSRFSRFVSRKINLTVYFSLSSFDCFAYSIFSFSKTFLSRALKSYYCFELSQTIISPYSTVLNFFNIFDSLTLQSFKSFLRFHKSFHYFIGYSPIYPLSLTTQDFVVYQGSNYSENVKISNLVLPIRFPLEESVTNINLFGKKIFSSGLPLLPDFAQCFSNFQVLYNVRYLFRCTQIDSFFPSFGTQNNFYTEYEKYFVTPMFFDFKNCVFQFSPKSIFLFTSPLSFFYSDLMIQLSAPLALQSKILLKFRVYLNFY